MDKHYVSDHKEGIFQVEIYGYFAELQHEGHTKTCLVCGDFDCLTMGELLTAAGVTEKSVIGRRIMLSMIDEDAV